METRCKSTARRNCHKEGDARKYVVQACTSSGASTVSDHVQRKCIYACFLPTGLSDRDSSLLLLLPGPP